MFNPPAEQKLTRQISRRHRNRRGSHTRRRTSHLSAIESLEARCVLSGEPLLISEFLAANGTGLQDRFREYSDWIELYNPTDHDVSLEGWSLTDDPEVVDKWAFPEESISARATMVVFASGRDRSYTTQHHTNFRLKAEGEYLALVRPDGSIAHEYAAAYPPQQSDISFGIRFDESGPLLAAPRYFVSPTPGAPNGSGVAGFAEEPTASVQRGFFDAPFPVSLASRTPASRIRYTTDGSQPTAEHGEVYDGPITIETTTTLRAVSYAEGLAPSLGVTQTYIFLDDVLQQDGEGLPEQWGYFDDQGPPRPARMRANYEMDPEVTQDSLYRDTIRDDLRSIPTLSVVLDPDDLWDFDNGLYMNPEMRGAAWERPVSLELIGTDGNTEFATRAGIKIHGGWARRFSQTAKLSFRIDFGGTYGPTTLAYPWFGPDAATEFSELVLRGGFNDSWRVAGSDETYLQDQWTRATQNAMGGYAPHETYVHLYLNGMYWGLYSPTERPNALWAANYMGGDPDEYDVINTGGGIVDGDAAAWNQLVRELSPRRFNYETIKNMVDLESFVDYLIVNQFVGNWDWPHNNWYASRRRVDGAKWQFHTWDAEAAFQTGTSENRVSKANISPSVGPSNLYLALIDVPEFQRLYADRIYHHFFGDGVLTSAANAARLRSIAGEIDRAIVGESARWGDGKNDAGRPMTRDRDWIRRIELLATRYFPARHTRMLDQYRNAGLYPDIDPPEYTPWGGFVTADTAIQLVAPRGDTYYTTDGADPLTQDGQPSDGAIRLNSADLVTPQSPARLLVPTEQVSADWHAVGFDDSAWTDGRASFGYETDLIDDTVLIPEGFEVRQVLTGMTLNTMAEAESVLAGENVLRSRTEDGVSVLNYQMLGPEANFDLSLPFPIEANNFALEARGRIQVRKSGTYTFAITSNDAAKLVIDGQVLFADELRHSTRDAFVTAELTEGPHDVELVMFQRSASAVLEFSYAAGEKTGFDSDFVLVGDPQHRSFSSRIAFDLRQDLLDHTASVYSRIRFVVENLADIDRVELRMFYDDGFIAYLNGQEIARVAAPDPATFGSTATGSRSDIAVLLPQVFELPEFLNQLKAGDNVLAIQALNLEASDPDLLISPQLVAYLPDSSFRLSTSAQVKARSVVEGRQSPLTVANFSLAQPASRDNLRISEIHYHPSGSTEAEALAGFNDGDDFEFIELLNVGSQRIDLREVAFQQSEVGGELQGVRFEFLAGAIPELDPGQRVLVVEDQVAFEFRYGQNLPVAGQWVGRLGNASEMVTLVAGQQVIHQFAYRDKWHPTTDGDGRSLERIDPIEPDLERWAMADAWRASSIPGGTPGTSGFRAGDANRDGIFDASDLLLVLQAAEFEDDAEGNSVWEEGDWDGDGDFTTADLTLALATNRFESAGPTLAVAAVLWGDEDGSQSPQRTRSGQQTCSADEIEIQGPLNEHPDAEPARITRAARERIEYLSRRLLF